MKIYFFIFILLMILSDKLQSQEKYFKDWQNISKTFTIHLDDDEIKDTIIMRKMNKRFAPQYLIKGVTDSIVKKKKYTKDSIEKYEIYYPDWENLDVKYSFLHLNDDEIKDIFLIIKGQVLVEKKYIDTTYYYSIFSDYFDNTKKKDTLKIVDNTFQNGLKRYDKNKGFLDRVNFCAMPNASFRIAKQTKPKHKMFIEEKTESNQNNVFKVSCYPNPSSNILNIKVESINLESFDYKFEIFDITTSEALEIELNVLNKNEFSIDVSNFTNGVYILRSSINGTQSITKIIINQ